MGRPDRFSLHDISAERWQDIDAVERGEADASLPSIAIDLWFEIDDANLHRVIPLLPGLEWSGDEVGLRLEVAATDPARTLDRFRVRQDASRPSEGAAGFDDHVPSPEHLREFLASEFGREYEFRYYVLDRARFDDELQPEVGYEPQRLDRESGTNGHELLRSLVRVDFLHAQRHLSDSNEGGRAEDLSRRLGRFYERNLEQRREDHDVAQALARSRTAMDEHLSKVFESMLSSLSTLGYPGVTDPRLIIRSALNPATVMSGQDGAQIHYQLAGELTLPDKYSGLGFKNLVYMVVELLDLHRRWIDTDVDRPPLHLVFVEEPEAHLHAQLQQVFVGKVQELLSETDDAPGEGHSQVVLTTHSPHITYERGFKPIRYFRRGGSGLGQHTSVLNLSKFYRDSDTADTDFLERYMKLTHCDLFFADAAVLVEGNVERLLVPQMIDKAAPGLRSAYLCVLEIGGAHGHRFRELVEFLCIDVLVITDLDSVSPSRSEEPADNDSDEDVEDQSSADAPSESPGRKKTCETHEPGATTANQVLRKWHPCRESIAELLEIETSGRTVAYMEGETSCAFIAYPGPVRLGTAEPPTHRAGRTLEEAFAFDNLDWTQLSENRDLGLRVKSYDDAADTASAIHRRVKASSFKKTDFALTLLFKDPEAWRVPTYIADGLRWLEGRVRPDGMAVAAVKDPD